MSRRIISLLCALVMLLCVPFAQAETVTETSESFGQFYRVPETTTYQGGVVIRGYLKGASTTAEQLELAYVLTSMPYILLNQPTTWEVTITGGTGDYTCQAILYRQDLDSTERWYYSEDSLNLTGNTLEYTFTRDGRYFWEFRVIDEGGEFFSFQTRPYETYTEADESDPTTTVGKANWVVSQVIKPGMSDYDRALALHDWLIYNANYDYTYTHRDAAGVLLYGTGVCDSYGRAYLMLCTIAGLECMYISGTAGDDPAPEDWGAHGWNMVKLNGKWYHVDCTWDDPGAGGYERHKYFCVDDETLSKDHRWNRPDDLFDEGVLPPEVEGGEFETGESSEYYDFTFSTWEEFFEKFDQMVLAGKRHEKSYGLYTGSLSPREMYNSMGDYTSTKIEQLFNAGLAYGSGRGFNNYVFYYKVLWNDPTSYIAIAETAMRLSLGDEGVIVPQSYYPQSNAFTWTSSDPSVATVSATYTEEAGLVATITAISAGETTITASIKGGESDSVVVTVLPAFAPDFGFNAATDKNGVTLSWDAIPGVTEYRVYRRDKGSVFVRSGESLLATTTATRIYLSKEQLPNNVEHELYIEGVRMVGDQEVFNYLSEAIPYGKLTLDYTTVLPPALTVIEDEAFEGCAFLTSVKIPSKVTRIGEDAFAECTSLTTIRIPASVTYIGEEAFEDCPLQYAEVDEGSYAEEWLLRHFPNIHLVY